MKVKKFRYILLTVLFALGVKVSADTARSDSTAKQNTRVGSDIGLSYVSILKNLTADKENIVTEVPEIEVLNKAENLRQAQLILKDISYTQAAQSPNGLDAQGVSWDNNLPSMVTSLVKKQRQLTFVIIPGLLGEFIETRTFEEIFARDSSFKREWQKISSTNLSSSEETNSIMDLKFDSRFDLEKNAVQAENLSDLINVASVDDSDGQALFKLVILKTQIGSLESIGSNADKAKIFNRRLQKYFTMTQDQNIILVGYSRGTPLALEMVVQAEKDNLSYLGNVRTVVSYVGVVMGSTLADVTEDANTESGRLFLAVKKLQSDLQYSESLWDRPVKFSENSAAIARFLLAFGNNTKFDPKAFLENSRSGDFKSIAALVAKMGVEMGYTAFYDFNGHVARMKLFISEILNSVEDLKTKSMLSWWRTNTLPKDIQYLSLAAVMVDPDKSLLEKSIFDSKVGYNDSLDDRNLLENKRTYEKLSGIALNDSQVAIHQSLFLPKIIANLNSANADLNIKTLGLLQTHHWGVSLQVVNKMRDGRLNPFPREKVLLALAAYINQ